MTVLAIGSISGTQGIPPNQSDSDYKAQIHNMEKQKEQLQKKVRLVEQDETIEAADKQQEIALYQAQIQAVDAQIQQLEQKQAAKAGKQRNDDSSPAGVKSASGVNIEE